MDHIQYAFLANAVDSSGSRLREYKILFYESRSKKPSLLEVAPKSSATYKSCSLCLVKPHVVAEGNVGSIIQAILNEMDISACQKISFTKQDCAEFLQSYSFLPRFSDHIEEMASGACYAIEVRGSEGIVSKLRAFAGPYDAVIAKELAPDSLRARFGRNTIQNAVHITDLETDGTIECAFAFDA